MRDLSLSAKLALALALVAAAMAVSLFLWVGPAATRGFLGRSSRLVEHSTEEMHGMARENTSSSRDVLVQLIRHTSEARSRMLSDLPLSLYEGDEERIRDAIRREDGERSERLQHNAGVLAAETERRAMARIDGHLELVEREQLAMGAAFSEDLRNTWLVLCGVVLTGLILLLGAGLYRLVVAPIRGLQQVTQAVTRGDLDVAVDVRSGDEVGALAADFAVMVRQLRESRDALTSLNRNLEDEVARKTRHLQQTLDDLGATHKQLVHAEKMAAIGTLAGGVAHEFNNLVGGIRGCASEVLADEQDAGRRETLEVILRATDRARMITRRLLHFSRRRVDDVSDLDVATVLDDALRLIEHEAKQRNVRIVRRFAAGLSLRADADALHQVFLNLFTNALQAMPRGGELTVEAVRSATEVSVKVSDNGVGIAPEHLDHVFEPFYTSKDREKDPAARGTGLGLSVSFGLVAAHGGTILVQSRPGAGAVFTVVLPLAGALQEESRP